MSSPILAFNSGASEPLIEEVSKRSGQDLQACYQCRRCAAGCPVAEESGWITPDRLIRMVVLGDRQGALVNELVWKCACCYTCGTRCPNDIMTGRITETLKKMAKEAGIEPLEPKVAHFHDSFVGSALRWGRVNELEFMGFYELKNSISDIKKGDIGSIISEIMGQSINFGLPMLKNKRMHFGFQSIKGRSEIKGLLKKAKKKKGGPAAG